MKRMLLSLSFLACLYSHISLAQDGPIVTNVRAFFQPTTKLVDIYYDLILPATNTTRYMVGVFGAVDGRAPFGIACRTLSGAGSNLVTTGKDYRLTWNAAADWSPQFSTNVKFKVCVGNVNAGFQSAMKLIPEISEITRMNYYMDTYHVSWQFWDRVRQWGLTNGYTDLPAGSKGSTDNVASTNHPVTMVNWYDCVKWCNARSEMEGLAPCYYSAAGGAVYRTDQLDLAATAVDWSANGYRLPTHYEWGNAAQGGVAGAIYPWGNDIDGSKANYSRSGDPYDNGTTPIGYYNGSQSPAGVDMANGYGLYDMVGNASQWTWNLYSGGSGRRELRGGSCADSTYNLGLWLYSHNDAVSRVSIYGFRCARGLEIRARNQNVCLSVMVDTTSDSDGDGITSGREQNLYGTNPNAADTDGDGLNDFVELSRGLNPLVANNPAETNIAAFVSWDYFPWNSAIPVTVSNRARSTVLDIYYTLTDTNAVTAEVRGFAAQDARNVTPYSTLYPLQTFVEGTAQSFGAGVAAGTNTKHLAWDAGVDVGHSVTGLQVRIMARTATNLPMHFVTIPADTNGPAFSISRYQKTFSPEYEKQMLLWFRAKGMARLAGDQLVAVGGSYDGQQVTTGQALNYPAGAGWLAERLGVRLATAQERQRAMQAGTAGRIPQWPMYYVEGKTANAVGIETTDTNAWYFAKDEN